MLSIKETKNSTQKRRVTNIYVLAADTFSIGYGVNANVESYFFQAITDAGYHKNKEGYHRHIHEPLVNILDFSDTNNYCFLFLYYNFTTIRVYFKCCNISSFSYVFVNVVSIAVHKDY